MTAHALVGVDEACVEAGMDDYLPKPLRLGDLKACLTRWHVVGTTHAELHRARKNATPVRSPPRPSA